MIPWALAAVSPPYNVPGVNGRLKLNSAAIVGIFDGSITKWNDPKIQALNKNLNLPSMDITPVHRSDGSGTTYAFYRLPRGREPEVVKSQVGTNTAVDWPGGVGARGSSGVSGVVKNTPGAITYVDAAYSIQNICSSRSCGTAAATSSLPGLRGISSAVSVLPKKITGPAQLKVVDPPKTAPKNAYPISTFTYVIVATNGSSKAAEMALEAHLLGGDPGPEVRAAALLRAAAEPGQGVRPPADQADPGVARRGPRRTRTDRRMTSTGGHPGGAESPSRAPALGGFRAPGDVVAVPARLSSRAGPALVACGRRFLGLIAWKVIDLRVASAIKEFGLSVRPSEAWNPVTDQYGALAFIYGTVTTSLIALVLATPLSIAIALFLTEISPRRLAGPLATMVELLAAIPSVVLGLWGILVFGPGCKPLGRGCRMCSGSSRSSRPAFAGRPSALVVVAALVLTIMIIPITSAICRELFLRVPPDLVDASLAVGSTRWEAIRKVLLPLCGAGHRGGHPARPRQGVRRGDRGQPGDRRRKRDPDVLVQPAERSLALIATQYQSATSLAPRVDPLPRGDPAGDLAHHERGRPGDRHARRARRLLVLMSTTGRRQAAPVRHSRSASAGA